MKNFINFLPPWVETNIQPAFYDKESGSVLQQTARMYAKVNQLVRIANEQWKSIQDYINQFLELRNYVDEYFDNLDVQTEINHKLDEMVETGEMATILHGIVDQPIADMRQDIRQFENGINTQVSAIDQKLDVIGNGSPLVASSVSGMTDTTRVYVNTTNGKWYYYDGDSWEIGGDFQSSGIGEGTVTRGMVTFHEKTDQLFDYESPDIVTLIPNLSNQTIVTNVNSRTLVIPCVGNTTYTISIQGVGNKFCVFTSADYPTANASYLDEEGNPAGNDGAVKQRTITTDENANYLSVFFWNTTADSGHDYNARITSIMINEGDTPKPWNYHYNLKIRTEDIENKAVTKEKIAYAENTSQLYDYEDANIIHAIPNPDTQKLVSSANSYTLYIPCEHETTYSIQKFFGGSRFCVFDTETIPATGVDCEQIYGNPYTATTENKCHYTTSATANYLGFFFYNRSADPDIAYDVNVYSQIMINEGDTYDSLTVPVILPVSNFDIYDNSIESNKIKVDKDYLVKLDVFPTIGCIGDSYTEGYFNIGGVISVKKNLSYPASIERNNGNIVNNYGKSGATTRTYLTSTLPTVLSDEASDLYIMALGINDANQLGLAYLGSIDDIIDADYTLNPDTFYGNYGKIIQQIKNHAPKAKIVLVGCMRPASMNDAYRIYTNAIEKIAEHYSVPFFNPMNDDAFQYQVLTTLNGNHPTATGYNAIARVMERNISRLINENANYFLLSSI